MKIFCINTSAQSFRSNGLNNTFSKFNYKQPNYSITPPAKQNSESNNKKTGLILSGVTAVGVAGIVGYQIFKGKSKNAFSELKQIYNSIIKEFPEDKEYYTSLAKGIGLKPTESFKLSSIVGVSQLKKLLKTFTPKDFQLGQNYEGVGNYSFRVSLHNHTQASDGLLSVRDFLEQSVKWADKVAKKVGNDGKPPFTVAITDHDTLSGLKEAIQILAENPEKFKNLKVVLGSEISVSHLNPEHVIRPVDFELIGYSMNPFNKKLNTLLENLKLARTEKVKVLLEKVKLQYPGYDLNFADAQDFHLNLKNVRTNGVLNLAGDYAEFKIRLTDYIKRINETIIPQNQEKLDGNKIFKTLGKNYYFNMDATKERDMAKFLRDKGLKPILEEKGLLNDSNRALYNSIFDKDYSDISKFINKSVEEGLPTLQDKKNYCLLPEEVFKTIDNKSDGFFGVAHPAIIKLKSPIGDNISQQRKAKLGTNDANKNLVFEIFHELKKKGKELFCATEVNYQSYWPGMDKSWLEFMRRDIANNPLLKLFYTGGTDTHSPSIFSNHSYMPADIIEKYNLQDILGVQHETFANILKSFQK